MALLSPLLLAAQCNDASLTIVPVIGFPGYLGGENVATLNVVNTGGVDATLGEVSAAKLGLSAPFSLFEGGTCTTGAIVPKSSGSCTLFIAFTPTKLQSYETNVVLEYSWPGSGKRTSSAVQSATGGPPVFMYRAYGFEFFNRPLGTKNVTEYRIMNQGGYPVRLGDLSDQGLGLASPFYRTGGSCEGGSLLAPLTECSLNISYVPTALGFSEEEFDIRYSWLSPELHTRVEHFSILGSGDRPLYLFADTHYFAPTPVGSSAVQTIRITNFGGEVATLGSMTDAALGLAPPFSIAGGTCRTGLALPGEGESCTLDVQLRGATAGYASDQLDFAYSWPGHAAPTTLRHFLAGTAVAPQANDCFRTGCATGQVCGQITSSAEGAGTCIEVPPPPPSCVAPCVWEARRKCLPVRGACNQDNTTMCDLATHWASEFRPAYPSGPMGLMTVRQNGATCYAEGLSLNGNDYEFTFSNGTTPIAVSKQSTEQQVDLVWCGPYTSTSGLRESDAFVQVYSPECESWRSTYLGLTACRSTQLGSCAGL